MLTKTTIVAVQALLVLSLEADERPRTPKQLASQVGASPTYMGKILGLLVKAGLLRSVRGAHGGVLLARKAGLITLLDVYVATQGQLAPDYCSGTSSTRHFCGFHTAMLQLHEQLEGTLSRWTLADLAARPTGKGARTCRMAVISLSKPLAHAI